MKPKTHLSPRSTGLALWTLLAIPFIFMLWVWLSPLSFVPVPWPDDSAFYFVAHELFKWPPRWVMLPQAPFEPTYRIYNFNTMPLYPILIGLGRFIGIDGSHALKLWPLGAWAASVALLGGYLFRARLPWILAALAILIPAADPILRWASVLVRPESLIGLCGMLIVLRLSFGTSAAPIKRHMFWDPIAAALALAAYAHFNAIHLLFPVIGFYLIERPYRQAFRDLVRTGLLTALYLCPWVLTVLWRLDLFLHQMKTQWYRLSVGNDWLDSPAKMMTGIFHSMGSPESWSPLLTYGGGTLIWILLLTALGWGIFFPAAKSLKLQLRKQDFPKQSPSPSLVPSAAWVLGSAWLWYSKPEVWFTYYLHLSVWTFGALALLRLWQSRPRRDDSARPIKLFPLSAWTLVLAASAALFTSTDIGQAARLGQSQSWRWSTYDDFVECVDRELVKIEQTRRDRSRPMEVWCPTFPDITIELSRRHPEWQLTRTNDFMERSHLAIQHGKDVDAVVVTETINHDERWISAPQSEHPEIQSLWMTWKDYFLHALWTDPTWKQKRYLCQRGRWQAFIFTEPRP